MGNSHTWQMWHTIQMLYFHNTSKETQKLVLSTHTRDQGLCPWTRLGIVSIPPLSSPIPATSPTYIVWIKACLICMVRILLYGDYSRHFICNNSSSSSMTCLISWAPSSQLLLYYCMTNDYTVANNRLMSIFLWYHSMPDRDSCLNIFSRVNQ